MNFFRKFSLNRVIKKIDHIINNIGSKLMDDFLELLLKMMRLASCLNINGFKKNIEGFNARYVFKTADNKVASSVIFEDNKMKVKGTEIDNPKVKVIFKDSEALCKFLTSGTPDVFDYVLKNKLSYEGNLNYLMKFAYMAIHLTQGLVPKQA